jgi:hypothetical protein
MERVRFTLPSGGRSDAAPISSFAMERYTGAISFALMLTTAPQPREQCCHRTTDLGDRSIIMATIKLRAEIVGGRRCTIVREGSTKLDGFQNDTG